MAFSTSPSASSSEGRAGRQVGKDGLYRLEADVALKGVQGRGKGVAGQDARAGEVVGGRQQVRCGAQVAAHAREPAQGRGGADQPPGLPLQSLHVGTQGRNQSAGGCRAHFFWRIHQRACLTQVLPQGEPGAEDLPAPDKEEEHPGQEGETDQDAA